MSANVVCFPSTESTVMRPVESKGRKANADYRTREHLTESEMAKVLSALKANRYGHRDWLIGLRLATLWRAGEWIPDASSTSLDTPASPTRCAILRCHRSRSKTSGDKTGSLGYIRRFEAPQPQCRAQFAPPPTLISPRNPFRLTRAPAYTRSMSRSTAPKRADF